MHAGRPPIEPAANRWRLPLPELADDDGLCGIGADLAPGTLLAAYRTGIFPMPMRKKLLWGYDLPYLLTGLLNQHPREAIKMLDGPERDDFLAFYDQMIE